MKSHQVTNIENFRWRTSLALTIQVEILKTQLANEQVARDLVTQQFRVASSEKRQLQKQVSIQEKTIIDLKSDIDEQTVQLIGALKDKDRLYSTSKVRLVEDSRDVLCEHLIWIRHSICSVYNNIISFEADGTEQY